MEVERMADADAFLDRAGPLLLEDEARHNLALGIAGTLRDRPDMYPEHRLWVVTSGDDAVAAALQTPPFNLVVARPRAGAALDALADGLAREDLDLPGVTAATPEVDSFAAAWETRTQRRRRLRMTQRIYRAARVRTPGSVPGAARRAAVRDRQLLVGWLEAFAEEALGGAESPVADSGRWVDARLGGAGGFLLWEVEGAPVSVAGWGGRTPNGIRVGPVYTPPEHRRRGYGAAVTAAVTAEQLAAGRSFCFLYTDLANPTSNRIYTAIGYEPVCDSLDYAFDRP